MVGWNEYKLHLSFNSKIPDSSHRLKISIIKIKKIPDGKSVFWE